MHPVDGDKGRLGGIVFALQTLLVIGHFGHWHSVFLCLARQDHPLVLAAHAEINLSIMYIARG